MRIPGPPGGELQFILYFQDPGGSLWISGSHQHPMNDLSTLLLASDPILAASSPIFPYFPIASRFTKKPMKRVRLCSTSAAPGGANPQRLWWNHNTPEAIWWWAPLVLTMIPMTENSEVVNIYLDIFEYINKYIYICVYIIVNIFVCIYICIYIYMYVYMYIFIMWYSPMPSTIPQSSPFLVPEALGFWCSWPWLLPGRLSTPTACRGTLWIIPKSNN